MNGQKLLMVLAAGVAETGMTVVLSLPSLQ
jgi:hypothetical protein